MFRRIALPLLSLFLALRPTGPLAAQQGGPLQPPTTGGLPALLQELRMLGHNKRVLVIAAHPDDEDTELLVMLTRREGAEAAYLSLTRGEGGQNLIGNELGEALGILRTEELLAARNIDGAQQFFTRAYDFGFSKTLDDTWAHWPKDSVLKDVVRIVRRFRPQVIVAVFSGTPRDGHGQHQASGWAAQEAFRIAGDASRFPELRTEEGLEPWAPTKLYTSGRFGINPATLTLDGGEVEKLSGRTYHQLAMAARSLHRSQDMGVLQEFGPSPSPLHFLMSRSGAADVGEGWAAFWSGVDTVLRAPPEHFAALSDARAAAGRDPSIVQAALLQAQQTLVRGAFDPPRTTADLDRHLESALRAVRWSFVDFIAERRSVVPGEAQRVTWSVRNAGRSAWDSIVAGMIRNGVSFWSGLAIPRSLAAGEAATRTFVNDVPPTAAPTTQYYLRAARVGDLYDWTQTVRDERGLPGGTPDFAWRVRFGFPLGPDPSYTGEVVYRVRDQAYGEIRRPVMIVPRIGVKLTPSTAVVRTGATGEARTVAVEVALESGTSGPIAGNVMIEVPANWPRPAAVPFQLGGAGATAHLTLRVTVPAGAAEGQYPIRAVATDAAGQRYEVGVFMVDYPHIRPRQYTKPATARIEVVDLVPPPVRRVAYIRGAADQIPEALRAAGLDLTLLDSTALETGDLSRYDAVVVGPRAYEVDSALVRNNARLLDYARNGGRLVVQYQQGIFTQGNFAPFPVTQGSPADRITDEHSPVVMLGARPSQSALAPLFRTPNAIGPDDWDGWVQDRALYCLRTWDPAYASLLSMNDPGERPVGGCLLEAPLGRGSYVYTGLAFFRQLPAGVPGAYRLFFNLLGGRVTP